MKPRLLAGTAALAALLLLEVLLPADDSQIYSEAFRRLVSEDDTYGGSLNPTKVYASLELVDHLAELSGASRKIGHQLAEKDRESISRAAEKLSIEIVWIKSPETLPSNELGEIEGGGVLVEFGEVQNKMIYSQLTGSINVADSATGGARYDFIKVFGDWKFLLKSMKWIS